MSECDYGPQVAKAVGAIMNGILFILSCGQGQHGAHTIPAHLIGSLPAMPLMRLRIFQGVPSNRFKVDIHIMRIDRSRSSINLPPVCHGPSHERGHLRRAVKSLPLPRSQICIIDLLLSIRCREVYALCAL